MQEQDTYDDWKNSDKIVTDWNIENVEGKPRSITDKGKEIALWDEKISYVYETLGKHGAFLEATEGNVNWNGDVAPDLSVEETVCAFAELMRQHTELVSIVQRVKEYDEDLLTRARTEIRDENLEGHLFE